LGSNSLLNLSFLLYCSYLLIAQSFIIRAYPILCLLWLQGNNKCGKRASKQNAVPNKRCKFARRFVRNLTFGRCSTNITHTYTHIYTHMRYSYTYINTDTDTFECCQRNAKCNKAKCKERLAIHSYL